MEKSHNARTGLMLGLAGIVVLSPDSLLLKLFSGGDAGAIAGRSVFMAAAMGVLLCAAPRLRAGFRWRPALLYGVIYGVGLACFPYAVRHTYVANALVILTISPLLAAVGARFILGEKLGGHTWLACALASAGVAIIFAPQLGAGFWLGNLAALLSAATLAACAIVVRANPAAALAPGLFIGALLNAALVAPFAEWQMTARDLAVIAVGGGVVMPVSFLLIIEAGRRLPAAEVNLLFLLEMALAPLLVWLALDEVPPAATIAAGVLIAAVLTAHSLYGLRRIRATR